MKILIFFLCIMASVLLSCDSNGVKSTGDMNKTTNDESAEDIPGSISEETPKYPFNRETFDQERQLWLNQDIQNYSFYQDCTLSNPGGLEDTIQFIKNGKAQYFRRVEWYTNNTEVSETHEDGSTSGSGYGTGGRKYRPGEDLYTTKGRKTALLDEGFAGISIPITSLYEQINNLEKKGEYSIYIKYDSQAHYPSHLLYMKGTKRFYLYIKDLVIDPDIPDEDNAEDPYQLLPEDM